jgi:glutamate 5-kinase
VAVQGEFLRGAVIVIHDAHQRAIARGVARYASADLRKIAGKKSTEIEPILGYFDGDVAVHRDEMIISI